MRSLSVLVMAVVTAMAGGGCLVRGDDNANGGLANTGWTVISIGGVPTLPTAPPEMSFAPEGVVSGTGGCNQYTGSFRTDGDRITIGQIASTMMLCDGERGAQESAFHAALNAASTWRLTENGNLEMSGGAVIVASAGIGAGGGAMIGG